MKTELLTWLGGILIGFGVGIACANYTNPFEECSRMYQIQADIAECVFIKTDG